MKKFFSIVCVLAVVLTANAQGLTLSSLAQKVTAKDAKAFAISKTMNAPDYQKAVADMQKFARLNGTNVKAVKNNTMRKAEGGVVEFTGTESAEIYHYDEGDWSIKLNGSNDDFVYLDYYSDSFEGQFTLDDFQTDYTYYNDADYNLDMFTTLELTVTGSPTAGYSITGYAIGESGTKYTFNIVKPDPLQPTKTVEVDGKVSQAVIYDQEVSTFAVMPTSGENVVYHIAVNGLLGKFSEETILKESTLRNDLETGAVAQYDHGTVEITLGDNYTISAVADLVLSDTVEYKINFTYELPIKEQKEITATNVKVGDSYLDWYGYYWVDASNDDYTVEAICMPKSGEIIAQDFTSSEIYFYVVDNSTGESTTSLILDSATQTIDEYGKPAIKATFVGQDLVRYVVDMSFVMPDEKGTKELTLDDIPFNNYLSSGSFKIAGYNADYSNYVSFAANSNKVVGEYSFDDGTLVEGSNYLFYYTDMSSTEIQFLKGNATVTMDEDGAIVVRTHLFGDDGYWYDMTINSQFVKAHLDYDCEYSDVDVNYETGDLTTESYDTEGGYGYVRLINYDRQDIFSMLAYCDANPETVIPEGTYEINYSCENPSIQPGEAIGTSLYPTFYGTFDDEGSITTIWFLVEGTVKVYNTEGKMSFEVNGKNSYDRTIHITYNMGIVTDINTAKTQKVETVKKQLKKNNIIIRKGNKIYNALGQEIM